MYQCFVSTLRPLFFLRDYYFMNNFDCSSQIVQVGTRPSLLVASGGAEEHSDEDGDNSDTSSASSSEADLGTPGHPGLGAIVSAALTGATGDPALTSLPQRSARRH